MSNNPPVKVYISGQISGLEEHEYRANFDKAADLLRLHGFTPVNPLEIEACQDSSCGSDKLFRDGAYQHTWQCYMKYDIIEIFDCDAIFMLDNWVKSRGAILEREVAKAIGLQLIITVNGELDWINL